jgi:hypothetical protein
VENDPKEANHVNAGFGNNRLVKEGSTPRRRIIESERVPATWHEGFW